MKLTSKKIIIVLTGIIVLIIAGTIILRALQNRSNVQSQQDTVQEQIEALPTGILVPTEQIEQSDALDIVSVNPKDMVQNADRNTSLTITFTRAPLASEIRFFMKPDAIYTQTIEGNNLRIEFLEPLLEGTLYTYSVNFTDDPLKIRVYRFVTDGALAESLPDTYDEQAFVEQENYDRVNHPDIYLMNAVPFENEHFAVNGFFQKEDPQHYYFVVQPKTRDETIVSQSLEVWLQLQGLGQSQIQELDIRYQ